MPGDGARIVQAARAWALQAGSVAMKHVEILREQARVLRSLAPSFDDPRIRGQLIKIADQCEGLARERERALREGLEPWTSKAPPIVEV